MEQEIIYALRQNGQLTIGGISHHTKFKIHDIAMFVIDNLQLFNVKTGINQSSIISLNESVVKNK